jgi:hypothetical protein
MNAGPAPAARPKRQQEEHERRRPSRWTRWLGGVLGLAVLLLLGWAARKVDWPAVLAAVKALPPGVLAAAAGLAVLSHLIYSTFDLIGRAWTGHGAPVRRVMLITFVCYAFNRWWQARHPGRRRQVRRLLRVQRQQPAPAVRGPPTQAAMPPSATPRRQGHRLDEGMGICHSYAPDGRCISLLKILLTNFCQYDCLYCVNRVSSNVPRARFTSTRWCS